MAEGQDNSLNNFLQSVVDQILSTKGVDMGIIGDLLDALIAIVNRITHIFDMPPSGGKSKEETAKEAVKDDYLRAILPAMLKVQENFAKKQSLTPGEKKISNIINQTKETIEKEIKEPEKEIKEPEKEIKKTEAEIKKPETEIKEPEKEIKKPETEIKKPETEIKKPEIIKPKTNESTINAVQPPVTNNSNVSNQEKTVTGNEAITPPVNKITEQTTSNKNNSEKKTVTKSPIINDTKKTKNQEINTIVPPVNKAKLEEQKIKSEEKKNEQKKKNTTTIAREEAAKLNIQIEENGPKVLEKIKIEFDRSLISTDPNMEFKVSEDVPRRLKVGGWTDEIEDYLNKNKNNLQKDDINYLNRRIATEKLYSYLEENKRKSEPLSPVKDPISGDIKLDHINQLGFQSTNNGCYSCSMELLLNSRGLDLNQQEIRAFRARDFANDPKADARMLSDQVGSMMEIGGIVTRTLPDTALLEKKYSQIGSNLDENAFKAISNEVRTTVIKALTKDKSPISMNYLGHYRTIIGYNQQKDELIFKDSYKYPGEKRDTFNLDQRISIRDLVLKREFSLTHLVDIDPDNPTKAAENLYGLEYIDDRFIKNDETTLGVPKNKVPEYMGMYGTDGNMYMNYKDVGTEFTVHTTMMLPTSLSKDEVQFSKDYKVEPINSPKKVALKKKIEELKADLPDPSKEMPSKSTYAKSLYFTRVLFMLSEMTPWQTEHALDIKHIDENISRFTQIHEFNAIYDSMDKNKALSYDDFTNEIKNIRTSEQKTESELKDELEKDNNIQKQNEKGKTNENKNELDGPNSNQKPPEIEEPKKELDTSSERVKSFL